MSLILNLDTALDTAIVNIAQNEIVLEELQSDHQHDHAGFLHTAIKTIFKRAQLELKSIDAVSVSAGPGSYTGLRVGMSSAKGICYALHKPLICIHTLEIMAYDAIRSISPEKANGSFFCPMIDARRMEVFTAIYDHTMKEVLKPVALVLQQDSLSGYLNDQKVYFTGSGAGKFKNLLGDKIGNKHFLLKNYSGSSQAQLAYNKFSFGNFADLLYAEPHYVKDFFDTKKG
jgi:tRNA threonylcarbamoyladenosine biosynthesis protein TsaB